MHINVANLDGTIMNSAEFKKQMNIQTVADLEGTILNINGTIYKLIKI